jgi:hypothetical protein
MSAVHPSDNDIQQYVMDNSNHRTTIWEHIQSCEQCKTKSEVYKLLIEGIGQQEVPSFDFDLPGLVLSQLPQKKQHHFLDNIFLYLSLSIVALLAGALLYLFRNQLIGLFEGVSAISILLMVTTMVTILTLLAMDLLKTYQKKMIQLNLT